MSEALRELVQCWAAAPLCKPVVQEAQGILESQQT